MEIVHQISNVEHMT